MCKYAGVLCVGFLRILLCIHCRGIVHFNPFQILTCLSLVHNVTFCFVRLMLVSYPGAQWTSRCFGVDDPSLQPINHSSAMNLDVERAFSTLRTCTGTRNRHIVRGLRTLNKKSFWMLNLSRDVAI